MYDIFEKLCELNKVTPYRVCKETGLTTATISNWKAGRYVPKQDKMKKIADFFGVTVDYLTTGVDPRDPKTASELKSDRDIAIKINEIIVDINDSEGKPIYFDGIELDEKTKEIAANFLASLKQQMEMVSEMSKKK